MAGERVSPVGLTPLYGGHSLELNRQAGFERVSAMDTREVIDNLNGACHPS